MINAASRDAGGERKKEWDVGRGRRDVETETDDQLVSELGKERDQVREDDAENALKGSAKGNTARASVSG